MKHSTQDSTHNPIKTSINIGRLQTLYIARFSDHGAYLQAQRTHNATLNEVLLPKKFCPPNAHIGDEIEVFVYTDSLDRPVATTQKPYVTLHSIAFLRVVSWADNGIFLDLGLDKDIFMPTKNARNYELGTLVCVRLELDKSNRLIAKKDIQKGLKPYKIQHKIQRAATPHTKNSNTKVKHHSHTGKRVSIVPFALSPLGLSCIVESRFFGLLYPPASITDFDEKKAYFIDMGLEYGKSSHAFIHKVREDGKLDLVLHYHQNTRDSTAKLLDTLRECGGKLAVHYDSSPESIRTLLGMSKKELKRALSELLRQNRITLTPKIGIQLC